MTNFNFCDFLVIMKKRIWSKNKIKIKKKKIK